MFFGEDAALAIQPSPWHFIVLEDLQSGAGSQLLAEPCPRQADAQRLELFSLPNPLIRGEGVR